MGNLGNSLKKFMQNKNTVTIIGVVLAIVVLYVAYNMRVKSAINPINVPYALEQIGPATQITADKIGIKQIPPSMLDGADVITNQGAVIDKYSREDTIIPKGSLFYNATVVEKEQLRSNIILEYPKGYVLYNLAVDNNSTYGNSVYPGNYVDIYLKATHKVVEGSTVTDGDNKMMLGRFISNIKVLAVKDASGAAVFSNLDEARTPSMIIFAVPEEYYILLKKAEYLKTYDSTLILVPTNESLKDNPGELESSEQLKNWINEVTYWDESMS